ncbi:MAG: nitrophenyl compound nitroreductase subunit ArsF family protein [Methanoregulaceae archaeon]|nr:nitrophenyl compound nitroreductase subunit ArsF family protein [Methanoregulaceae archaeon]
MNKKGIYVLSVLILLLALSLLAAGCTTQGIPRENNGSNPSTSVEKVEIYHFHATRQCYSCITLGAYAEETVKTYFAPEVAAGKVVFAHVNVDLPENKALVEQYGPTGSSLWIGVYNETGFHKEENIKVWYKIGNKDEYTTYLKGVIEQRLAGDFS